MKLRMTELKYVGHIISKNGIKPDPKKVETVMNMPSPTNVEQLRRFLGMISYLSKFLPSISEKTEPLRKLERKDHEFHWSEGHE